MKKTSKIKLVALAVSGVFVVAGIIVRLIDVPETVVIKPDPDTYQYCKINGEWVTANLNAACKERFKDYELE